MGGRFYRGVIGVRGRRVCYSEVQGSGLRVIRGEVQGEVQGGRFRAQGGGSGLRV